MDKTNKISGSLRLKRLMKLSVLVGTVVMLAGCARQKQDMKVPNVMLHSIDLHINAAAQSAAASLDQLAAIEKNQHPAEVKMPFMDIDSPELRQYLSVKYYGPIRPLMENVAKNMGYSLQVYGKEPSLPILVNINTTGNVETTKQILQNIDLQSGISASVNIYPQQRLITMRYFNNAPTI